MIQYPTPNKGAYMIKINPALSAIIESKITEEKKCEIISWTMKKTGKIVTKKQLLGKLQSAKKAGGDLTNTWFQTQNWLLQNQDKLTKAEETDLLKVVHG